MKKFNGSSMIVLILIFSFMLTTCLTENLKMPFKTYTPSNLGDGWVIGKPDDRDINMDRNELKKIYEYIHEDDNIWQIRSLLVFRNGKLIAESYMKDNGDRTNLRPIWSCTKQVTGILAGIAIENGNIHLDKTISDYLPQQVSSSQYAEKSTISIENLLMMESGINWDNDDDTSELLSEKTSNSLDYVLSHDMHSTPGTKFNYNDGDPHIVSAIIQETTGETMRDWARKVLFDKIGITRLQWAAYKDGITIGAFGILTTPRELAKIGQLVLNHGAWDGAQIVSTDWIKQMTEPKVSFSKTSDADISFGYYWWKESIRNISVMWGHGGQFIFLNEDKNLMMVTTAETRTQGDWKVPIYDVLPIYDRIINCITDP